MEPLPRSPALSQPLLKLIAGEPTTFAIQQTLELQILADERRASAFGIDAANVDRAVERRIALLRTVYPILQTFCQRPGWHQAVWLETSWNLWLPLAIDLADRRQALHRPLIQGLLGGQGSGKTTLGAVLKLILKALGYETLSWSIDDLYKTHAERERLQVADPRLIWRGPPGTHDVDLGVRVLDELRQAEPDRMIAIPRFDKSLARGSGDRTEPEFVTNIDIVLFEGWFVGVRPVDPAMFTTAPPPIETEADRSFARDSNDRLHAYLPLWERLDRLMVLYPVDYRFSQQWRKQAEQEMKAVGKPGMSDAEIEAFVEYFWKALHPELFIQPLVTQPDGADLVVEIDQQHAPGAVYRSGDR